MLFASLSQLTYNDMLQNEKTKLPATFSSLKPDCSNLNVAEKSNQPEDWLLHPIGYVFQFDAQKESDTWSDTWSSDYDNTSSDSTS